VSGRDTNRKKLEVRGQRSETRKIEDVKLRRLEDERMRTEVRLRQSEIRGLKRLEGEKMRGYKERR
jgi:hypothetical protein